MRSVRNKISFIFYVDSNHDSVKKNRLLWKHYLVELVDGKIRRRLGIRQLMQSIELCHYPKLIDRRYVRVPRIARQSYIQHHSEAEKSYHSNINR